MTFKCRRFIYYILYSDVSFFAICCRHCLQALYTPLSLHKLATYFINIVIRCWSSPTGHYTYNYWGIGFFSLALQGESKFSGHAFLYKFYDSNLLPTILGMQLTFHHINIALFHLLFIHLKENLTKTKGLPTVNAAEEIQRKSKYTVCQFLIKNS